MRFIFWVDKCTVWVAGGEGCGVCGGDVCGRGRACRAASEIQSKKEKQIWRLRLRLFRKAFFPPFLFLPIMKGMELINGKVRITAQAIHMAKK